MDEYQYKYCTLNYESFLKLTLIQKIFQSDILAHPNIKLFITHCGMHGVMEAIYHGVPMVGMPVFIDQVDVLARIEDKRIGVGLDKWASSDEIRLAIERVLNDDRCVTVAKYVAVLSIKL